MQYFSRLSAGPVWAHVAMSVLVWIFVVRLYLSTRERGALREPADAGPIPAGLAVSRS